MIRLPIVAFVLAALGGCGPETRRGDQPVNVSITLSEFDFTSSRTTFEAATPYRFVLRNTGGVAHEWAVVPRGATDETGLLIEVEEDELRPGATVVKTFAFPEPGEYDFACFMAGHYEAGMKLQITASR